MTAVSMSAGMHPLSDGKKGDSHEMREGTYYYILNFQRSIYNGSVLCKQFGCGRESTYKRSRKKADRIHTTAFPLSPSPSSTEFYSGLHSSFEM
jgi:hypothetical protein